MIGDGSRRSLLDIFPATLPITAIATRPAFYAGAAAWRPGLTVVPVPPGPAALPPVADGNVVLDGLGDVDDPAALLRAVREAAPHARLFALIPNGAHAAVLGQFLSGEPLVPVRPLVAADLPPLFAQARWSTIACTPLADPAVTSPVIPFHVSCGNVTIAISSPDVAERLSTAAFLVTADPA